MSLASFIQSHALAPASQAVGQRYRRWASKNPTLVQCLVLAVLSYHWTGTLLGQRGGTQMSIYYTPNQVPAYIAYRASPKMYMRLSANVRPASQTVSQHRPDIVSQILKKTSLSKKKKKKIRVEGRGGFRDILNYVQPQP